MHAYDGDPSYKDCGGGFLVFVSRTLGCGFGVMLQLVLVT